MKKNLKRILSLLAVLAMALGMLTGCGEQKTYEVTLEMGQNYVFDATKIFGVSEKEAKDYTAVLDTLDVNTAGTYEVKVVKGTKEYTVIYTVEDTKAPEVKMKERYVFAHDTVDVNFDAIADVKDASKVTEKLCKFVLIEDLKVLDEKDLKNYTKDITNTDDTEELLKRADDVPMKDGVYNAVYLVEDAYGHKTAKEVIVIFDTLAPVIEGVENIKDTVEVKDLEEEWTETFVDKLNITDNCDGVVKPEALEVTMKETDADNHTYKVTASYTDRAGNKTTAEYSFSLKERKGYASSNKNTNNDNVASVGETTTTGTASGATSSGSAADTDGDGFANTGSVTEINGFMLDTEHITLDTMNLYTALANAGYYNPIAWNNGSYYMIVPTGEEDAGVEFLWTWMSNQGIPYSSAGSSHFDINGIAMAVFSY